MIRKMLTGERRCMGSALYYLKGPTESCREIIFIQIQNVHWDIFDRIGRTDGNWLVGMQLGV